MLELIVDVEVSEEEVVRTLVSLLQSSHATPITKDYIINALMKLSTRFHTTHKLVPSQHPFQLIAKAAKCA